MPKPNDDIQDLKRRVALLARLEGRPLVCAEGLYLIDGARVRDPRALVVACRDGLVSIRVVEAALSLGSPAVAISPRLLATAQRDLSILASSPRLRALARESSRIFRRHGALDLPWIARKRAVLVELAEARRGAEAAGHDSDGGALEPWFARALAIVRFLYGDDAAATVREALARVVAEGPSRRRAARRRIEDLLAILAGRLEPRTDALGAAKASLGAAEKMPGRSRSRRVVAAVSALLELPEGDVGHLVDDRTASLEAMVQGVGERLLARLESTRSPGFREEALRFFATYAIAFDPRPREGGPLSITPEVVRLGNAALARTLDRVGDLALTVPEVVTLVGLAPDGVDAPVARLVADGLPISKVVALAALGHLDDLHDLSDDVAAASAYVDWMSALVPHYRSLGLDLPLTPEVFAGLRRSRNVDLGVLAVCLLKHETKLAPGAAEGALARLDATLGLFRTRPTEATSILTELAGTTPGAGRAELPALAAWLDDDALLDRYVHLARIAGLPVTPSRALRADFELAARLAREEAHLAALATRTAAQHRRLEALVHDQVAIPAVARTRRRFADRLPELMARGYQRRLDALFRRIFKEVWGIAVTRVTKGLAGAMRFYLATTRNRELLGTLLRVATSPAGVDVKRALPGNEAWITEASARFDVAAWLAPRSVEVTLGDSVCRLEVERDPLEVLRMGIPFGTCLSLLDGENAASTIVNAADANKLVIYLRDPRGEILARKLVAVADDFRLIGYRLYVASREREDTITRAFASFCRTLAEDTGLARAASGKPAVIHEGFWYDDGTVPFEHEGSGLDVEAEPPRLDPAVEAYCASIGLAPPSRPSRMLAHDARLHAALGRGDLDEVLALIRMGEGRGGIRREAALWAFDRIDPSRLADAVTGSPHLVDIALGRAATQGPLATIALIARLDDWDASESIKLILSVFPPTAELTSALIAAALAARRDAEHFNDHGLQHQTMELFPALIERLSVAEALSLCDRVEPLLDRIVIQAAWCADCKARAEAWAVDAIEARYAEERDPESVIRCLQRARSSRLAKRAALRIAARFALTEDASPAALPLRRREPLRPCLAARRALLKVVKSEPDLAREPDLLAALLRQSGTATPHGFSLPVPGEPPFEALGDLLVQLDLDEVLAPWLRADLTNGRWEPGAWELHHHRDRAELPPTGAPREDPRAERTVDPVILEAAWAQIERLLGVAELDDEKIRSLREALDVVASAELDTAILYRAIEVLVARRQGHLVDPEIEFVARVIEDHSTEYGRRLPPSLSLALFREPRLRRALLTALGKIGEGRLELAVDALESEAWRSGQTDELDQLVDGWLRAASLAGRQHFAELRSPTLRRRAFRIALEVAAEPADDFFVSRCLSLYGSLTDHEAIALFLAEVMKAPASTRARLSARIGEGWKQSDDAAHNASLEAWLGAAIEGENVTAAFNPPDASM